MECVTAQFCKLQQDHPEPCWLLQESVRFVKQQKEQTENIHDKTESYSRFTLIEYNNIG